MTFDLAKATQESSKMLNNKALEAIILGPSGGGKSFLLGTAKEKTLHLYFMGENHGIKSSARAAQDTKTEVTSVCVDYADGVQLSPDATYTRLLEILASKSLIEAGIKVIAVDGLSELETIIRSTLIWKKKCLTEKGNHNGFAETGATLEMVKPVLDSLKKLHRENGIHFVVTCILDVVSLGDMGQILESKPRLQGMRVAEEVVRQFGDVLVVGSMRKDNVDKHKLQFKTVVSQASKDASGEIKRCLNYAPRIAGVEVPALMDASLAEVISLKANNPAKK